MTDKEFRRLSRADLIEIIYELQQSEKALQTEVEDLKRQLQDRRITIENAGSLAEVLAKLSGLFEAAQTTADEYVEGTQRDRAEAQTLLEEAKSTREQADSYLADVKRQAAKLASVTMQQRKELLAKTEEECRGLRETARKDRQGEEAPSQDGGPA